MRPFFPGIGHTPDKLCLDGVGCLAGGHAGAVADTENMRVDGDGGLAKGLVQHHIRRFPADTGKRLERRAVGRHLAAMLVDQDL